MSPPSVAESRGLAPIRSRSRCRRISKLPSISTWQPRRSRLGRSCSRLRATRKSRRAGSSTRRGGTPQTPRIIARAARCCRSAEVAEFARYLKSTPPSEGSHAVFYPGEIEYLREQERRKIGIEIEDATWDKLRSLAAEYKIAGELCLA